MRALSKTLFLATGRSLDVFRLPPQFDVSRVQAHEKRVVMNGIAWKCQLGGDGTTITDVPFFRKAALQLLASCHSTSRVGSGPS